MKKSGIAFDRKRRKASWFPAAQPAEEACGPRCPDDLLQAKGSCGIRGKALAFHRKGVSLKKIRRRLLGFEDKMYTITGGHFSKQNVIDSILGKGRSGPWQGVEKHLVTQAVQKCLDARRANPEE
jgi:hypothetical protein